MRIRVNFCPIDPDNFLKLITRCIIMLINLRTSEANKTVVQELTRRLFLGAENYVSRIAFAYSVSKGSKLNLEKDLEIVRERNIRMIFCLVITVIIILQ